MSRILLGVSGGIAAYKACELTRLLVRANHEVIPLVTQGAERFVRAETFNALARRPAEDDLYAHLTRADLLVVAPCTANTLAKLAHGLADNVLTEAALAHRGPILVAPAMNPRMWAHPATRANAEALVARGVELVGPDEGEMAEGEWGVGRMSEPDEIARRIAQLLTPGTLAGKRVLVTAGGTREPLDAARYVGNNSSGRMGIALAEEARRRGAEVVLLAANLSVPAPAGIELIPTPTADLMLDAATALPDIDIALFAAAVADYRPSVALARKRTKSSEPWTVELEPTTDIAKRIGERKLPGQLLVAFGADLGDAGLERKRAMLETKHADLVVFNDVSRRDIGFDSADNEVVLISRLGERAVPKAPKPAIAAAILDEIEKLLSGTMSDAYELFQEGRARLRKGMAAQATVVLEKAKKLEPDKASIRESLGIAYFRLQRWDEAEREFRTLLELSPADDYGHYALGRALEKQGRVAEANGHFKLASTMNPENVDYASRIRELE